MSQGRFLFGIGGGWNQDEMEDHGTVYATRFKRVREAIEAMKEIWTKEAAEYHGGFVNFDPMIARPEPVQKPHPPIHVGGAFRTARAAPSATVMAGFQPPEAMLPMFYRNSAKWPGKPAAIRPPSRLPRSAWARISTG